MDPEQCKRKSSRSRHITIRINDHIDGWIQKHNFSPTAIFHQALKELGYSEDEEVPFRPRETHKSTRRGYRSGRKTSRRGGKRH